MRRLLLRALLCLWAEAACPVALAESFDKPTHDVVRDLGPSPDQPDYPNLHRHLSCHYFPRFMVKQLDDDGNKGALRIAITRLQGNVSVPCTLAHRRGEVVISDGWDYYWGVKGGLVILLGADGLDGGMNFDVFNATSGRKIYKDVLLMREYKTGLDFEHLADGRLSLRYDRVLRPQCSVLKQGATCWAKVQRRAGLEHVPMPRCDYSAYPDSPDDPSVVFYPVKVDLTSRPVVRALSQKVECRAAE